MTRGAEERLCPLRARKLCRQVINYHLRAFALFGLSHRLLYHCVFETGDNDPLQTSIQQITAMLVLSIMNLSKVASGNGIRGTFGKLIWEAAQWGADHHGMIRSRGQTGQRLRLR